jgi:hypothetical protein
MAIDMLTLTLKAMGIDPTAVLSQALAVGASLQAIVDRQGELLAAVAELQASQHAMMTAMGLTVPPPTAEITALIAAESQRYIDANTSPNAEQSASPNDSSVQELELMNRGTFVCLETGQSVNISANGKPFAIGATGR